MDCLLKNIKIGIGIITYNRFTDLERSLDSLPRHYLRHVVVVNDGMQLTHNLMTKVNNYKIELIQNKRNIGVGRSKNKAFKCLLKKDINHIFIMEDDISIRDYSVFNQYIKSSLITGIQHFNFSQHGLKNKTAQGIDDPVASIYFDGANVNLYRHCVGAFSYYSRECLTKVGLMDQKFYNAVDHIDHTYRIIKAGFHPPFWFFADIKDSSKYLREETWTPTQSIIASCSKNQQLFNQGNQIFTQKYGHSIEKIPIAKKNAVLQSLSLLQKKYGFNKAAKITTNRTWRVISFRRNLWIKLSDRFVKIWKRLIIGEI